MRLGALLVSQSPQDAVNLPDQAQRLEGEGFDSLWSAQAIGRGFMLMDPFVALTAAAVATSKVELGTAILQTPLYPPADIALKSFSLMQISGGRLLLGVGAGSTEVDHQIHHSEFDRRFKNFREGLAELRTWFKQGEFGGQNLSPWESNIGAPPLAYGTWGAGVEKAANEFSAWIASGHYRTPEELEAAHLRYRAAGGARAIVSTIVVTHETDIGELGTLLTRYSDIGFDDAVVMLTPGAPAVSEVRKLVS